MLRNEEGKIVLITVFYLVF